MAESGRNLVRTTCPECGARLKAPASKIGQRLPCPKCGHELTVVGPAPADDEYALSETTYAVRELPPEEYSPPVIPAAAGRGRRSFDDDSEGAAGLEDEQRGSVLTERPKLPPHPMLNSVLTFFLDPPAVICWLSFTAVAFVVLVARNMAEGAASAGQFGPVASFLMGVIAVVIGVIGLIAITGYLLAILQDSAAGNRVIIDWPTPVFLDWVGGVLYVLVSVFLPLAVAYAVAWPLGGVVANAWLVPVSVWLLFPVFLLSTLETQSPLVPISPMVLESLWVCGRTWIVFLLETCLLGVGLSLLAVGIEHLRLGTSGEVLLAGVGVAVAMLYFRLLGRLTWVCDERFRQKRAEEEDDEEPTEKTEEPEIRPTPVDDF
ncbi:MAG: hypothetical protein JW888_15870 [Pirellulales bacterium]|nr:hypothetical protein [Pirellulales bacterium]